MLNKTKVEEMTKENYDLIKEYVLNEQFEKALKEFKTYYGTDAFKIYEREKESFWQSLIFLMKLSPDLRNIEWVQKLNPYGLFEVEYKLKRTGTFKGCEWLQNKTVSGKNDKLLPAGLKERIDRVHGDFKRRCYRADIFFPYSHTLIEQKSNLTPLDRKVYPSNKKYCYWKNPICQALEYNYYLRKNNKAKHFITCNFKEIWVYEIEDIADTQEPMPSIIIPIESIEGYFGYLSYILSGVTVNEF